MIIHNKDNNDDSNSDDNDDNNNEKNEDYVMCKVNITTHTYI